jgi:hypothetical protein
MFWINDSGDEWIHAGLSILIETAIQLKLLLFPGEYAEKTENDPARSPANAS